MHDVRRIGMGMIGGEEWKEVIISKILRGGMGKIWRY